MKTNWLNWVLGTLGVGTGAVLAYKFVPLPGMTKLGMGTVVKLRSLAGAKDPSHLPVQITGKSPLPGMYVGTRSDNLVFAFKPADIASVVQRAPTIPLLT
jgi:hypothetical protein